MATLLLCRRRGFVLVRPVDAVGPVRFVEFQRELKIRRFVAREADWIVAGVARTAIVAAAAADGRHEAFEAQIGDAVGVEVSSDFLEGVRGGNQLRATWCVDAVEAR